MGDCMKTYRDVYDQLDEFGKIRYITDFVRSLSGNVDVYSKSGQDIAKKRFEEHLNQPYVSLKEMERNYINSEI